MVVVGIGRIKCRVRVKSWLEAGPARDRNGGGRCDIATSSVSQILTECRHRGVSLIDLHSLTPSPAVYTTSRPPRAWPRQFVYWLQRDHEEAQRQGIELWPPIVGLMILCSCCFYLFTFCVSRRRRKMYCGHARLCVCVSVCPRPHAYIARTRM